MQNPPQAARAALPFGVQARIKALDAARRRAGKGGRGGGKAGGPSLKNLKTIRVEVGEGGGGRGADGVVWVGVEVHFGRTYVC